MVRPRSEQDESPVFSHQVLALLARMAREDRDLIGAAYRRARSRQGDKVDNFQAAIGALPQPPNGSNSYLGLPSAIGRDRQTGALRVPHFDMKPIAKVVVPTSADGTVHQRFKNAAGSAARHFDYIVEGAVITLTSHLDYLQRDGASEVPDGDLVLVDLAEEHEERRLKNALALYTNIPGGPERQRSLFAAAEANEQTPKKHYLTFSTADLDKIAWITGLATSPTWLSGMERRLRREKLEIEERARSAGKIARHQRVIVAEVTTEQAYDVLRWFDAHPSAPRPEWKQGKTGRNHYRFVGELPKGISSQQRHLIMRAFVDMLAKDGWMAIGVIHQPDQHNDTRNYHFHVDAYDRPATWIEDRQCWDFEYKVRRNGKDTSPLRQKKVSYRERDDAGKLRKVDTAKLMRNRYIDIVNTVVGNRPSIDYYLKGTYADNGIDLTPLEHLGNRAAALERRGSVTAAGLRNARRIAADDLAAIGRQAEDDLLAFSHECDAVRARLMGQSDALAAVDELEWLGRRDVRRREETSIAEVVDSMSRSRAAAVAAVLSPEAGRRERRRKGDKELRQAALDQLAWVDGQRPSMSERIEERDKGRVSDQRRAELESFIRSRTEAIPPAHGALVYVPRDMERPSSSVTNPYYRQQMEQRLIRWIERNGHDPALLHLSRTKIRLGPRAPKAIDTLMQRFATTPAVQRMFLAERSRRYEAGQRAHPPSDVIASDGMDFQSPLRAEAQSSIMGHRQSDGMISLPGERLVLPRASGKAEQAKRLGYQERLDKDRSGQPTRVRVESLGKGPAVENGDRIIEDRNPRLVESDKVKPSQPRLQSKTIQNSILNRFIESPQRTSAAFNPASQVANRSPSRSLQSVPPLSQATSLNAAAALGRERRIPGVVRKSIEVAKAPSPSGSNSPVSYAKGRDPKASSSPLAGILVTTSPSMKTADDSRGQPPPAVASRRVDLARALAIATGLSFLPLRPDKRGAEPMRYLIDKTHAVASDLSDLRLIYDHQQHPRMQQRLELKYEDMRRAVLGWLVSRPSKPEGDVRTMFDHDPQLAAAVWTAWGHRSLTEVIDQARAVWDEREKAAAYALEQVRDQQNTGKRGSGR